MRTVDESSSIQNMKYQCIDADQMRFDPRQSMFMYGLCVAYDEANKNTTGYKHKNWSSEAFNTEYIVPFSNNQDKNIDKPVSVNIGDYIPEPIKSDLLGNRRELSSEDDVCDPTRGMANCWM